MHSVWKNKANLYKKENPSTCAEIVTHLQTTSTAVCYLTCAFMVSVIVLLGCTTPTQTWYFSLNKDKLKNTSLSTDFDSSWHHKDKSENSLRSPVVSLNLVLCLHMVFSGSRRYVYVSEQWMDPVLDCNPSDLGYWVKATHSSLSLIFLVYFFSSDICDESQYCW